MIIEMGEEKVQASYRSERTFKFLAWRRPLSFVGVVFLVYRELSLLFLRWAHTNTRLVLNQVLTRYGATQNIVHQRWWTNSCWLFLRRHSIARVKDQES